MANDIYNMNLNCIVGAQINYRIQKAGYNWQTSPTRNCPNNEVLGAIRELCDEFEERYGTDFSELTKECGNIAEADYKSFSTVLSELLVGSGLNWGRVIALLAFSSVMATECMSRDSSKVDQIREWTCCFMQTKVEPWITEVGGWGELVKFYNNGKQKDDGKWPIWVKTIGGVGAFALGAIIMSRG